MKSLCLMRHAKSSWKFEHLSDMERPLNKRGTRDAPLMGKLLHTNGIHPDRIISSSAKRALMTATLVAEELQYPVNTIETYEALYLADTEQLLNVVHGLNSQDESVLIVGHNPGLTLFGNLLTNHSIENVPTGGVLCLDFNTASWHQIAPRSASLRFFEYPKKYFS